MNCARNIITANFGGGTSATTAPLWQWDYGQVLCVTGIEDLPAAFEVHFSTNRTGGVSTTAVGADGQVTIPNVLLTIGKNLNAWIYLSDAQGEGETEYSITIPVKSRPMPETYDAEVSGEFDDVVRQVSEYAETAQTAADNAGASASAATASASEAAAFASAAETAKTAAQTAQGKAEDAQAAAETAAQTATEKAQQTAQDAAQTAQSKADAESAAGRAETAETGAESAKTAAETAARGAADSASAAGQSATAAWASATAAAGSASAAAQSAASIEGDVQIASQKAAEAQTAADQAVTAKDAAQTAQTAAETAATNAGQSASTATAKAAEAAQSATDAAASETAAEAAATRAEQAAASLTVDDALSDTSTNPVQNKVITSEITDVKSALDAMSTASVSDEGKALKAKTVTDGKVTEWEFGEAGGGGTVDDALSDTSTNPVENRVVTGAIRALQIEDAVSGAIVSITDGSANPIQSLSVSLSPIQEGSGDPSPDNVRPITGRDSVTVERTGKNLFNKTTVTPTRFVSADGTLAYSANYAASDYIPVKAGVSMIVSGLTASSAAIKTAFYDREKVFISAVSQNKPTYSFTTPSGAEYARITVPNADLDTAQLEIGSTATEYEPYDGASVTVQLGTTVYGGTVDVITGKATIAWKKYIGSAFASSSAQTGGFYSRVLLGGETYAGGQVTPARYACNMAVKGRDLYDKWYYYAAGNLGGTVKYVHMYIPADAIDYHEGDNVTSLLNAAYNASDFEFILPIPEPFDIDITPASLSTLRGDNNVWSDADSVTVDYVADPKLYIARLTEPDADMVADANIVNGQYFMVGNNLYLATANIASGATIVPGVNCNRTNLAAALNAINA